MATAYGIISNAEYHAQLVEVLDSLESAPKALIEQNLYIEELQRRLKRVKDKIDDMKENTREKKDLRTSMVKKMACRVAGKKEELKTRVKKEEREYEKALEDEMQERERQEILKEVIEEATRARDNLEAQVEALLQAQNNVSALYSRVFGRARLKPRGEFPRNDYVEMHLRAAEENLVSVKEQISSNEGILKLLEEADNSIMLSLKYLEECSEQYATWGVPKEGDAGVLAQIGRELKSAAKAALQAELSFDGARRAEPLIQPLQPLVMYQPGTPCDTTTTESSSTSQKISPLAFRKSDAYASKAAIKNNKNDLFMAQKTVGFEIRSMGSRIRLLKVDLSKAENVIRETEIELTRVRREIWDEVVCGRASPVPLNVGNESYSDTSSLETATITSKDNCKTMDGCLDAGTGESSSSLIRPESEFVPPPPYNYNFQAERNPAAT
ncbi:hypothetical protein K435DRAFT_962392 [Dendrothele bispora CBS 962.96]|uniref:Uncharacterized protein n=1 Tax=Dendrothele bispora (strain CBS 962.96) TaxID=1314807 RepID=A0A4S8MLV5_DENBC|nr:hypothetical protein K435DRAFT_962392 [Dendrothele bispora CBS 962.96]